MTRQRELRPDEMKLWIKKKKVLLAEDLHVTNLVPRAFTLARQAREKALGTSLACDLKRFRGFSEIIFLDQL